jgi:hypothetical protein
MIPEPSHALQIMMGTLATEIAPNMRDTYHQANVNLLGFAALLIAQELERAADVRFSENREMRILFARAAEVVDDTALSLRLRTACGGSDPNLRVSELTATNNELRRLLIELHAVVEEQETTEAAEIARRYGASTRCERAAGDKIG